MIDGNDADGTTTPAGEPDDDFFSSWDKPAIKKPTPPVSRTATPPVVGRTPSPFLSAGSNGKDIARASSPLSKTDGESKPAASRITTSAALRKTGATTGARKTNILGAKKTQKLGAKKITGDIIDFDEAEKKAKEEAERIEKLGYDPNAEEEAAKSAVSAKTDSSAILSPTPVSPTRGGYGSSHTREKSGSELERLGMGMQRLGFGQVGGSKPAAAAKKSTGGFGSVGPIKAAAEGLSLLLVRVISYLAICLLVNQMTKRSTRAANSEARRPSHQTSSSGRVLSTPMHRQRRRTVCRALKAHRPSRPTPTLAAPRRRRARKSTGIWKLLLRTSFANLESPPATTWKT